jgi:hypothetical protein
VTFYLGTHHPGWLKRLSIPLFISHRRLMGYRTLPVARGSWALDSGAFSDLAQYGRWTLAPEQYVAAVRRYRDEIGKLVWAAPQDWMCEPSIVAKTGLSVSEHQRQTVENFLLLRAMAPDLPFIPVVQGWDLADYLRCLEMYAKAGIDLTAEPLVGLGSVCRRQATKEVGDIVTALAGLGLRLHGFGVKASGLARYGQHLASADSMAWSFRGRRVSRCCHVRTEDRPVPVSEANCLHYALDWRRQVIGSLPNEAKAARNSKTVIGEHALWKEG